MAIERRQHGVPRLEVFPPFRVECVPRRIGSVRHVDNSYQYYRTTMWAMRTHGLVDINHRLKARAMWCVVTSFSGRSTLHTTPLFHSSPTFASYLVHYSTSCSCSLHSTLQYAINSDHPRPPGRDSLFDAMSRVLCLRRVRQNMWSMALQLS